jgi:hypothetical protein
LAHVALAFEASGGWHKEKDAIMLTVLQVLRVDFALLVCAWNCLSSCCLIHPIFSVSVLHFIRTNVVYKSHNTIYRCFWEVVAHSLQGGLEKGCTHDFVSCIFAPLYCYYSLITCFCTI